LLTRAVLTEKDVRWFSYNQFADIIETDTPYGAAHWCVITPRIAAGWNVTFCLMVWWSQEARR